MSYKGFHDYEVQTTETFVKEKLLKYLLTKYEKVQYKFSVQGIMMKNNKPYITVIINDGKIEESKSYGNRKNTETEKVLPYLKWLFKHEKITGVGQRYDYGYSPDTNMGIKDFLGITPYLDKSFTILLEQTIKVQEV